MRIVIDDEKLNDAVTCLDSFINKLNIKSVTHYSGGMDRIDKGAVREKFDDFLKQNKFERGETVTHACGIGNNCQYPIYYTGNDKEWQQVGYINLNSGLYGEVYCNIFNFNQKRVSNNYEILTRGIKVH